MKSHSPWLEYTRVKGAGNHRRAGLYWALAFCLLDKNTNKQPKIMAAKKIAKKTAKPETKPAAKKATAKAPVKKAAKKAAKKAVKKPTEKPAKQVAAKKSAPIIVARPSNDVIARAAYLNYRRRVEQGLPGDSRGDWLEAERQLAGSQD
jgi:hypothetical protein